MSGTLRPPGTLLRTANNKCLMEALPKPDPHPAH